MKLPPHRRMYGGPNSRVRRGASGPGAGFSIVELLLVCVVMAMMAVAVGSSMDSMLPKERLNTSVRRLTAEFQSLRSEAISRGLDYYIEYDLDEERYRRILPFSLEGLRFNEEKDDDEDRFKGPWQDLAPGVELAQVAINGIVYDSGPAFARFDPRGAASDHQVVLSQPQYENFYTVEVLALTGTFKFHRGSYVREAPDERDFD